MSSESKITLNNDELESSENESFGSPIDTMSPYSTPSPTPKNADTDCPESSSNTSPSHPSRTPSTTSKDSSKKLEENRSEPKMSTQSVIRLLIPISICMLLSLMLVKFVCKDRCAKGMVVIHITPIAEDRTHSYSDKAIASLINALVFVSFVCSMTSLFALMIILRFYKIIFGYLVIATSLILVFVTQFMIQDICYEYNIPLDNITLCLFLWNYAVLGILCIFWKGPLIVQQSYLILNSVLVSVRLMVILPEWSTWTALIALAIWDLIAVLCPLGPLRLIVETLKRRKEKGENVQFLPGMIYSTMVWTVITDLVIAVVKKDETDQNETKASNQSKDEPKPEEEYRPKLGLGDFIFYSILVGKASVYEDWNITIGCYIGVLVGLGVTLIILTLLKHALPALPVSILFGIFIFFITKFSVTPFFNQLQSRLIYI